MKLTIFVAVMLAAVRLNAAAPVVPDVAVATTTLIAYTVAITSISYPNPGNSFTTIVGENQVGLTAVINPENLRAANDAGIHWVADDDPAETGDSGTPAAPANGAASALTVTAPAAAGGRGFPLNFRIRAYSEIQGGTAVDTTTIKQDVIDQIRQEYVDMSKARTPARTEFSNGGASAQGHFTFAEMNSGDFAFAIVAPALYAGLESMRTNLGNQAIGVTSGYRNPRHNAAIGGAAESQHIYGTAADMHIADYNGDGQTNQADWNIMSATATAAGATFIEPYAQDPTHLHADWR